MLDINSAEWHFTKVEDKYFHTEVDSPADVWVYDLSNHIESTNNIILVNGKRRKTKGYGVTSDYQSQKCWFWIRIE